jgi:transcriptional regulator with XRE-family HTH domain
MSSDPKRMIKIARESGDAAAAAPLDLGERVRALRKAKGWTLEQAAGQAGLARSTLSKIENGQMSPTYDALKKLDAGTGGGAGGSGTIHPVKDRERADVAHL